MHRAPVRALTVAVLVAAFFLQALAAPGAAADLSYLERWVYNPAGDGCFYRNSGQGAYDLRLCEETGGAMHVFVPDTYGNWSYLRTYGPFADAGECVYFGDGLTYTDRACESGGVFDFYTPAFDGGWIHQFSVGPVQIGREWQFGNSAGYGYFDAIILHDGTIMFSRPDIGRWHNAAGLMYYELPGGYYYVIMDLNNNYVEYGKRDPRYGSLTPLWDKDHGDYPVNIASDQILTGQVTNEQVFNDALEEIGNPRAIAPLLDINFSAPACIWLAGDVDWNLDGRIDYRDRDEQCG